MKGRIGEVLVILASGRSMLCVRCFLGFFVDCFMINYNSYLKGYGGIGFFLVFVVVFIVKVLSLIVKIFFVWWVRLRSGLFYACVDF